MKVVNGGWRVNLDTGRMITNSGVNLRRWCNQGKHIWFGLKIWVTTTDFFPLLCCLALGLSSVNFVRVAVDASRFGLLYLLLQTALSILIGLPVILLELGVAQICQQGAAAVWRAVPALKGIAFVKVTCALVLALCSGVQAALLSAYAVRSATANLPMSECSQLTMTEHGYFQNNTFGLDCAMRTFLKPFNEDEDPFWFSIMCIIIFIVWIVVPVCLYNLDTGLKYTLAVLASVSCVLCLTLSITIGRNNMTEIFESPDWSEIGSSRLWFAAVWQVLLSSRLGLAYLDSTGSTIYIRSHSIRWAITLVTCNVLISWLGVIFWFSVSPNIERDTSVLAAAFWIYDSAVQNDWDRVWPCLSFVLILLTTVASMMTLLYPVFDSLSKSFKYQWRLPALGLVTVAIGCTMAVFSTGLEAITFLERFAIPLVVCLIIVVEIAAFLFIYGWRNLRSDLEFMLGDRICVGWVGCWILAALLILSVAIWELYTAIAEGWPITNDSILQLALLLTIAAVAIVTVIVWAILVIIQQEEYDSLLKVKSSFKPSRKWGPVEPILRHLWIQWTNDPHNPDLVTQIYTQRRSVTATILHGSTGTHSDGSASRKSSLDEYESRKSSSENIGSLEEITSSKRSSFEQVHNRTSKLSSDNVSNQSSRTSPLEVKTARGDSGVALRSDYTTAQSVKDNTYSGLVYY